MAPGTGVFEHANSARHTHASRIGSRILRPGYLQSLATASGAWQQGGTQLAEMIRMNGFLGGLGGLALCFWATTASAQVLETEPAVATAHHPVNVAPQPPTNSPPIEPRWYGWQGLAVDGPAAALWLTSIALLSIDDPAGSEGREQTAESLAIVGAIGYGAGAPTVHLFHRHPWHALGSLGMRAALPALGGAVGLGLASCPPASGDYGNCGMGELIIGAATGALVAIALDTSVLAWESPRRGTNAGARLGISPVVSTGRRELRVFGTF